MSRWYIISSTFGGGRTQNFIIVSSCVIAWAEVIKRYRTKAEDNNPNEKFIYNAKKLNLNLTVRDAGLVNESKIFVMVTEGIVGGKK